MSIEQIRDTLNSLANAQLFSTRPGTTEEHSIVDTMVEQARRIVTAELPDLDFCLSQLSKLVNASGNGTNGNGDREEALRSWAQSSLEQLAKSSKNTSELGDEARRISSEIEKILVEVADRQTSLPADAPVSSTKKEATDLEDSFPDLDRPIDSIDLDPELAEAFEEDALRCLTSMEQELLDWDPEEQETPRSQLGRDLHTLKGAAGSCEMPLTAKLVHEIESWLLARADQDFDNSERQLLMNAIDTLRKRTLSNPSTVFPSNEAKRRFAPAPNLRASFPAPTQVRPIQPSSSKSGSKSVDQTMRVRSDQVEHLLDLAAELVIMHNQRHATLSRLNAAEGELFRLTARLRTVAERTSSTPLDEVSSDVEQLARTLKDLHEPLNQENESFARIGQQIRHEIVNLRRQPVAGLFQRLQRAADEAARVEGKQVRLVLNGSHAGLENSIQEMVYSPLLHLVRNAVSHGIEPAETRAKQGKPSTGKITLNATGNSHQLVIEVSDDGRGLDFDAIRERAISQGLISVDQRMTESEMAKLIFRPGFSTKEKTTSISGRGVGLDVVWNELQRIHSRIEIESKTGQGTVIRVSIPLPNMIEHVVIVRSGSQVYAIPLHQITRIDHIDTISEELRSEQHCLLSLGHLLDDQDLNDGFSREVQGLVLSGKHRIPALDRDEDNQRTGQTASRLVLCVEEVLGTEEIVVRPLPRLLSQHPFITGASLSGNGEMVMLISPVPMLECADGLSIHRYGPSGSGTAAEANYTTDDLDAQQRKGDLRVLLVDDSTTVRKTIRRLLKPYAIDCQEANDGLEALDLLQQRLFDLVISDIEMPRMNGIELLDEINSLPTARQPVTIVISSREDLRNQALKTGALAFLPKPVSDSDITQILNLLESSIIENFALHANV